MIAGVSLRRMRVAIFGASGMVGGGVLLECLDDPRVASVLVVGRTPTGVRHAKLEEILHPDFFNFSTLRDRFTGLDACFFCLGTTSAGKTEADYTRQTYDLTLAAAREIVRASPDAVFVYVSGVGTDSTERGPGDVGAGQGEDGERSARARLPRGLHDAAGLHSAAPGPAVQARPSTKRSTSCWRRSFRSPGSFFRATWLRQSRSAGP